MGADGYTGNEEIDDLRIRFPANTPQIWMIDPPQDQIDNINDSLSQDFLFVTWVKGTDGNSRWCRFSLAQTWQNQMPGGPGIALVGNQNGCVLAAQ
ncbi:MAG: hypothetical protein J7545_08290 [Roseofilum sp. SBFL]|uniref:hypothetical protein n=1 Tax=unclassified Roseofilum TaxID=2620099 RepID=UPI001B010A7D|nr:MULTISPECIES: hypothetical protein [unclassified Roseofilum]MBP0013863.1 hypothetical protein [Roseofilum sp. SID3]MBP0026318.1 hypothetical protein [Roseofilum sp. SID2]MBP0040017.1 hypothetical protein [Roseofilum sp. SID1]MBP0041956.1 hypothetical protein [Roseofilum sp. SBFL]